MKIVVETTDQLKGTITIPGSKSHTIRAIIIAALAVGTSRIKNPLMSEDSEAAVTACRAFGAKICTDEKEWIVEGFGMNPVKPDSPIYLANSGTTTRIIAGISSLFGFEVILDGDSSLRMRPMQNLIDPLNKLGADISSINDNGSCPIRINGRIKGGVVDVDGISSQFVTSLLLAAPLADGDIEINVTNIHEESYINMTLKWLDDQGIMYEKNAGLTNFKIKGNQCYKAFDCSIPADWSSAAFPIVAAAICKSDIVIKGLDINDSQGDKAIITYLKKMGADIETENGNIRIKGRALQGREIDINNTPDALPALSVLGCFAKGTTKLYNVAQARIKETDRISVMAAELSKMGCKIMELPDGLIIKNSCLTGSVVEGHNDHRVVMALALAGLIASGTTHVNTAEAVNVTFPEFVKLMKEINANINMEIE